MPNSFVFFFRSRYCNIFGITKFSQKFGLICVCEVNTYVHRKRELYLLKFHKYLVEGRRVVAALKFLAISFPVLYVFIYTAQHFST